MALPSSNKLELPLVQDYMDYRAFLKEWIDAKKSTSKAYTHRYIAAKVGLKSGGHISQILSDKAKLSGSSLDGFIELMKLNANDALYFKYLVCFNQAKTQQESKTAFDKLQAVKGAASKKLDADQYEYYSHWSYSAIREALSVFPISDDEAECKVLGRQLIPPLPSKDVAKALTLLKQLELIELNEDGLYQAKDQILTTGKQLQGLYLNEYIQEVLKLAQGALHRIPVGQKYNSWISMAIGEVGFKKVVNELRDSRKRILKIVQEENKPDRVYHLNLNLFPFTHIKKKK